MTFIKKLTTGANPKGLFKCEFCGKEVETNLYGGKKAKSCKKCMYRLRTTHKTKNSDSQFEYVRRGSKTRLYRIWRGMKARCYNPNAINYKHYGGKGISVYPEWKVSYKHFAEWAIQNGYNTENENSLSIERKNSSLNYEPSNCKWITMTENVTLANESRAKKVYAYNGDSGIFFAEYNSLKHASEGTGVNSSNISKSITSGSDNIRASGLIFKREKFDRIVIK